MEAERQAVERSEASEATGQPKRALAIGAPVPARAFREVLVKVLAARGFAPVGAGEPGELAVRVAPARERAGWLLVDAEAGRAGATDLARDMARELGAPATICSGQGVSADAGVLLRLSTVEPDGTVTHTEEPAEREDDDADLELERLVELSAVRAVTDGDGSAQGETAFYRANKKAPLGNRRLDDIVRAVEAGARFTFEDRPDGRVTVRVDRGSAGRQISLLTRDEAAALRDALA